MTLTFENPAPKVQFATLLYGPPGTGKSVGAASAPDPILYLNADRPNALRFARQHNKDRQINEVKVTGRESIEQAFLHARDEKNDIKTVVWDSLGRIYDLVLADLAKDDKHPSLPERGDANTFIERHILALLELPVHVVLVAHDLPIVVAGNEDEGGTYETVPFTGTKNPALGKKIMRAVDVVGYCGRVESDEKGGPARYVAQLYPAGGRHGKDGTAVLGDIADLDLAGWAHLVSVAFSANGKDVA